MNALQSKIKSILLILLEFLRNPNAEEYYPFLINRIQRIYAVKKIYYGSLLEFLKNPDAV